MEVAEKKMHYIQYADDTDADSYEAIKENEDGRFRFKYLNTYKKKYLMFLH